MCATALCRFCRALLPLLLAGELGGHCLWAQAAQSTADGLLDKAAQVSDPDQKLQLLRQAAALSKDPRQQASEIEPALAAAYVRAGRFADAAAVIVQMRIERAPLPRLAEAQRALALGYAKARRYPEALEQINAVLATLDSAIAAKEGSASNLQQSLLQTKELKGEVMLGSGDAKTALELLLACQEQRKQKQQEAPPSLAFNLARAASQLGRNVDARQQLAEAYALALHRVRAIEFHAEAAGPAVLDQFAGELDELRPLLRAIEQEAQIVVAGADSGQWLEAQFAQFEKRKLSDGMAKASLHMPAPAFNLRTLTGTRVRLADLKGKVVLLNFWDISCKPCRAEYPHLKKIQDDLSGQVAVLMVSLDADGAQVAPFAQKSGFASMVLLKDGSVQQQYGVEPIPHNFIIDQAGIIRFGEVGFTLDSPQLFRAEINHLLEHERSQETP